MTPEQRVKNYLAQNQSRLQLASSIDAVISDVKLSLFYGFSSGLSDEQLHSFTPNLVALPDVFDQGVSSAGNIARAVAKLPNISAVRNITSQLKPDLTKVGDAFDAVGAISDTKPGVNFGFKIQNPPPAAGQQGIPSGVQGVFTITWVI